MNWSFSLWSFARSPYSQRRIKGKWNHCASQPTTSLFPGAGIPSGVLRGGMDLREKTGLRLETSGCGSQVPLSVSLLFLVSSFSPYFPSSFLYSPLYKLLRQLSLLSNPGTLAVRSFQGMNIKIMRRNAFLCINTHGLMHIIDAKSLKVGTSFVLSFL